MTLIKGLMSSLWQSPAERAKNELAKCREDMSELPRGSMGARVVEIVGGNEAFCALPVLPWQRGFGPWISNPGNFSGYDVDPNKVSHSMMRGKDARGEHVFILRKHMVLTDHSCSWAPSKRYSFVTTEVISPPITGSGQIKGFGNSTGLRSSHCHVEQAPPLESRPFEDADLNRLSQLCADMAVRTQERRGSGPCDVTAKLV